MQRKFMIISASSLLMIFVLSAVTSVTALAQKPEIIVTHRFIESRNLGQGVDWNVNGSGPALQGFNLTAVVKFANRDERKPDLSGIAPGQRPDLKQPVLDTRSFSATGGAEARTKTLPIGKVSLVNIQAAIEEVKVRLIAETKFSGRNEVAQ